MANNGAITVGTALPAIYAKCYLYLPAGAIAAGVPAAAAWLYAEMTSTTLGTVYNNSFDPNLGATPTAPAKVAFATTGPGAYAGVTAEITNVQAAIPAAAMGVVGQLQQSCVYSVNNTAGAKTCRLKFGGSSYAAPDGANGTIVWSRGTVTNAGESGRQVTEGQNVVGNTSGNTGPNELTIDTSAATTCAVSTQKAVATDNIILRVYAFDLIL
jgi:hypothetical protein